MRSLFPNKQSEGTPPFNHNINISSNKSPTKKTKKKRSNSFQANEMESNNFKVVIRIRPPLKRELGKGKFVSTVKAGDNKKSIQIREYYDIQIEDKITQNEMYNTHKYTFDYVYDQDSTQEQIYEHTAKQVISSCLEGYNATMLAYGQTGTGKTYTMEGMKFDNNSPLRGVIPRSIQQIFNYIQNSSEQKISFMVRTSYLQIYNETLSDLLRSDKKSLQIREDQKKGVYVEGLSEWVVRTPKEIYALLKKGSRQRKTASTKMNDISSRSHAVFIIIVEQMTPIDPNKFVTDDCPKQIKIGKVNLVDLAGSERVSQTGAKGVRLEESKSINKSLSSLGNVINALVNRQKFNKGNMHVPYRDSKLTRLLEDSLGGNCKTTMMVMISPSNKAFGESLSSLKFANRAKNIKNKAQINEDVNKKALLRKYEIELQKLKKELLKKNSIVSEYQQKEMMQQQKQTENFKQKAIQTLQKNRQKFLMEREQKIKLEKTISMMSSQVLVSGQRIEETPQFRNALNEQRQRIRQQYDTQLQSLECERKTIQEDKAQVSKYKQLLLKQRDIMIALTSRLNERDETIAQLQEELQSFDTIHNETEEQLDLQIQRVDELEQLLMDNYIDVPPRPDNDNVIRNDFQFNNLQSREFNKSFLLKKFNNEEVTNYGNSFMKSIKVIDGQKTYNITSENLGNSNLMIQQLKQLSQYQQQQISILKKQLNENANKSSDNLQRQYDDLLKSNNEQSKKVIEDFDENFR